MVLFILIGLSGQLVFVWRRKMVARIPKNSHYCKLTENIKIFEKGAVIQAVLPAGTLTVL
jgi:hypothetical protein